MSKFKYFGYWPDTGFELFATKGEAQAYASEALADYRDQAGEGWSPEVNNICWGKLKQEVVMTDSLSIEEAAEKGIYVCSTSCDGYEDYGLRNV